MIKVTKSAVEKLQALIMEHPEDPIVRVRVRDQDENTLTFSITLEDQTQPDDEVQDIQGLTLAVEEKSASRMDGMTIDYQESQGFKFRHPEPHGHQSPIKLDLFNLN
jgi:iron-sulfur cluster assembly accessory protein